MTAQLGVCGNGRGRFGDDDLAEVEHDGAFDTESAPRAFCSTKTTVISEPTVCSSKKDISCVVTMGASPNDGSSSNKSRGRVINALSDDEHLTLSSRQRRGVLVAEPSEAGKQLEHLFNCTLAFTTSHAPKGRQFQVVLDGELFDDTPALWNVSDAESGDFFDGLSEQLVAAE